MVLPPSWALAAAHAVRYAGLRSRQPLRTLTPRSEPLPARVRRLQTAWQQSRVSDIGSMNAEVCHVFDVACVLTDYDDVPKTVSDAFTDLGEALAEQNHNVFAFPTIDLHRSLTAAEARYVVSELNEIQTRLEHDDRLHDLYTAGLSDLYTALLNGLPDQAFANGPAPFSVPLYALIDPKALINFFHTTFLRDLEPETPDAVASLAFAPTRNQLWDNLLAVSKMTPAQLETAPHKLCWPEDSDLSPPEMVRAYLAHTPLLPFAETELPYSLPQQARFEHCHIVGGSGHGKTQLLQLLIHGDLEAARDDGPSVVIIDSQGDLIRTISHLAAFDPGTANSLADRFMLIDPNDIAFPVALNMFDVNMERINSFPALEREKILNGTIELYEYIFGALLGAELTQKQGLIFRYLARLMMVIPGATIQTLRELLEDGARFKPHFSKLDGSARHFFESEYLSPSFKATKTQALRRLWGVLSNPTFERMFSHQENKVDLFEAMNSGKIILINTAKDLLKQEGCEIFGRFFIAMIAQAALQRAAISENERRDTFVYVDEAHDYFDDNIENLLNQARKYRVGLTLAHQNLDQLSSGLRASIMSSTSIKLVGGLSAKDAKTFAPDMRTNADFLQSMRKSAGQTNFACYVRNQTETALKVSVPLGVLNELPQIGADTYAELIDVNRRLYCSPIDEVVFRSVDPANEPTAPTETSKPTRSEAGSADTGHRQLQQELKQLAQSLNYAATIELRVLDGAGSVDVAIDAHGHSIACEISATTRPNHELQNVEKCLAAGFAEVWMIAEDPDHLEALRKHIAVALDFDDLKRLRFLSPDDAHRAISSLPRPKAPIQARSFGYDIAVEYRLQTQEEKSQRQQTLNQIFASAKQPEPAE